MAASPVDTPAGGTALEVRVGREHQGRNLPGCLFSGHRDQEQVAFKAAGKGLDTGFQIEAPDHLAELLIRLMGTNVVGVADDAPFEQAPVPGKQYALLRSGDACQLIIAAAPVIECIETEQPQRLSQASQVGIQYEERLSERDRPHFAEVGDVEGFKDRIDADAVPGPETVAEGYGIPVGQYQVHLCMRNAEGFDQGLDRIPLLELYGHVLLLLTRGQKKIELFVKADDRSSGLFWIHHASKGSIFLLLFQPGGHMARNREAVRLENVWFERDGRPILENIRWCVGAGERWLLLGPNGSGKTTLLRLICGYSFPSRGRMCVLDHRFGYADLRELHKHIGWVHADLRAMIPEFMSALEVVHSGRRGSLVVYDEIAPREKQAAREIMDWIGTAHLAGRSFATLSTGERQRVLIARALSAEPDLLLLDEPCLGLDPLSREEFLASLERLYSSRKDLSVIYVTHHVEEITPKLENLLVLAGGRLMAAGEMRETLTARVISSLYGHACRLAFSEASRRYELSFI